LGATAGAVIGRHGAGLIIGAVTGELVGGATGATAEAAGQSPDGIAYTIKLTDGRVLTVIEHHPASDPIYPAGSMVAVETRGRTQHVIGAIP
jgi:outer membrane lipoprotein SlyB